MMRNTLPHSLLLEGGFFVALLGYEAGGPAMNTLTDKKAELKVLEVNRNGGGGGSEQAGKKLSPKLVDSMGETFNNDYLVEAGKSSPTVKLRRGGCIKTVVEQKGKDGLTNAHATS